jgi:replicative DNA helicase
VEPLILCSTAVLASGERKSASNSLLTKPLRDFENVVRADMAPELARQKGQRKLEEGRLEALKKAALTGRSLGAGQQRQPPTREDEEAYLAAEQAMIARKMDFAPRWILDDATPEAIASILNQQGGAISVISTEPGIFGTLAGRYSSKGSPNLETVLQATAGDPIHIDRKGDPDNPIRIEHPALSMTLAMQPGLLPQLSESGFRDSGLLARFLWVMPEPRVGTRNTGEVPIPPAVAYAWAAGITELAKAALASTRPPPARYGEPETAAAPPRTLTLTPAAKATFNYWRDWLEPRLHPRTGDLGEVADWGSKLPGQVAKIALALTLLSDAKATEIQEGVIADAITLGNALISHVKAAFAGIYSQSGTKDSRPREVLEWLVAQQLPRFTVKTVFEGLRGRVWAHRADAVKVALAALASDNHVRQVVAAPGPKGGRPSAIYELNPVHLSQ